MTHETPPSAPPDADIEQMLQQALDVPQSSEHTLRMLRAAVAREWRRVTPRRRVIPLGRRAARFGLAAAAVVTAAAVTLWIGRTPAPGALVGAVTRLDGGGVAVREGFFGRRDLNNGDGLRSGDRLTTRGAALISLARGGTLRLAAHSAITIDSPSHLSLQHGLIYVDIPPQTSAVGRLFVATPAGTVEHVGTEFEVFSEDRTVRVRVREGRVRFLGQSGTVIAGAGTELLAVPGEAIARRSIDTYGNDWQWTSALAPDYDIEGQSLIRFLNWVSREMGRPVDFADANARQIADRTILHGSVHGQPPLTAMSNVLLTASLTYEIRGGTIWVRVSP